MGHPAGVSQKSDGRQPCGRRDACVENRCSVVPRCLTSLSVGMLVRKCWLCESVRAAVTNTTGWVAETAAIFFFFKLELLLLGLLQQACHGWVSVLPLEAAETRCLHPPPTCVSGTCRVQFSSVAQSCPTLCDLMNCSTPGLPVHHQLQEFTQTHVHRVGDALQPSHPLSSPSPPAPNPSQHQSFPMSQPFA